ncbi:hypothetical protein [Bradyrhizobium japonicum]|uniref:hypothetical protein n=1 Tax=Bradyrhizobium japonicum TaxID=375 RepID=UPI001E3063A0|nr:hypothetical protein [Bradyrhizobium japonicum]MCD9109946.1 hypothetical protein [Bradyrhizobium japonicum]MCD9259556.1 hypothetical protein [Bradyrhizobium japonicum SEMIA 5079]MCD9910408.1 hypothetical protein [Bradyrhizobium japonicum]MCS3977529.1 hypothetical protein [Bradyrhizobium japonicum]WRI76389.1 hypothetical protein RZE83_22135 [Bradyrhizobium japonicum]
MGKHLAPVDLETLCGLDVGAGERACTEVQRQGLAFGSFIETAESRILVGYVRAWLRDTFAAFTGAGIQE